MTSFVNIYDLPNIEFEYVLQILAWISKTRYGDQFSKKSEIEIIGHLCCLVQSNFICSFADIAFSLRILLQRYTQYMNSIIQMSRNMCVVPCDEGLKDSFTDEPFANPAKDPPIVAMTISDASNLINKSKQFQFLGSFESWTYHCLVNGLVHPLTRQPIKKFAVCFSQSLEGIDFVKIHGQIMFFKFDRLQMLVNSLQNPLQLEQESKSIEGLLQFESLFGIPRERSFANVLLASAFGEDDESLQEEASMDEETSVTQPDAEWAVTEI